MSLKVIKSEKAQTEEVLTDIMNAINKIAPSSNVDNGLTTKDLPMLHNMSKEYALNIFEVIKVPVHRRFRKDLIREDFITKISFQVISETPSPTKQLKKIRITSRDIKFDNIALDVAKELAIKYDVIVEQRGI
jgi:hypothetical protein